MKHSVWDWHHVRYDYYESPLKTSIGGWNPLTGLGIPTKINKSRSPIGIDIEAALPLLPRDAVFRGTGVQAVGQVCRRPSVVAGVGVAPPVVDKTVDPVTERHLHMGEVAAFLGGMALGSVVARQKTITTLVIAFSSLLLGLSASNNVVTQANKLSKDG